MTDFRHQLQALRDFTATRSRLQKLLDNPVRFLRSRLLYRASTFLKRPITTHASTFWGESLNVVLPDTVSYDILRYQFYEYELSYIMCTLLKPNMVFWDVGAHFGYFSSLALKLVGSGGQVHAFEPTPSTFRILSSNLSSALNAKLNNVAAYSDERTLSFADYGHRFPAFNSLKAARLTADGAVDSTPTYLPVKTIALDQYAEANNLKPHIIKIDAESAEGEILDGMQQLLGNARPLLSIEVGDVGVAGAASSRDLLLRLVHNDYRPFEYSNGAITEHAIVDHYEYGNLLMIPIEKVSSTLQMSS